MKFWSFMLALFCAGAALAKSDSGLFNQAIREGIKQDVKKDGISQTKLPNRSPASVQQIDPSRDKPVDKIENQFKQLGTKDW